MLFAFFSLLPLVRFQLFHSSKASILTLFTSYFATHTSIQQIFSGSYYLPHQWSNTRNIKMNKLIETLPSSSFAYILVVKDKGKHDYKYTAKWWLRSCTGGQSMGVALFYIGSLRQPLWEDGRWRHHADVCRKSIPGQWFFSITT